MSLQYKDKAECKAGSVLWGRPRGLGALGKRQRGGEPEARLGVFHAVCIF